MTKLEKLARVVAGVRLQGGYLEPPTMPGPIAFEIVDAILRELREPDEGMLAVGNQITEDAGDIWEPSEGISYGGPSCALECWQGMIDQVMEEKTNMDQQR